MKVLIQHLLLLLSCCYFVHGKSDGALVGACDNMVPGHSVDAQTKPCPFIITLDKTSYGGNDVIAVTLSKNSTNQFKGYLIQARNQDETKIPGFALIQNSKFLECNHPNDAVTHTESSGKDNVTFQFTAPATSRGNITIFATAVENKDTFWVKIPSETIVDMAPTGASLYDIAKCCSSYCCCCLFKSFQVLTIASQCVGCCKRRCILHTS